MNEAAPVPSWALPACRLWQRDSPAGLCLAGVWGGVRVLIYRNPDKRDADDADFVLCFSARVIDRSPQTTPTEKESA